MLDEAARNSAVMAFTTAFQTGNHQIFFGRVGGEDLFTFFRAFISSPTRLNDKLDWSEATQLLESSGVVVERTAFAALYHRKNHGRSYDHVCRDYGIPKESVMFLEEVFDKLANPIDLSKEKLEDYL